MIEIIWCRGRESNKSLNPLLLMGFLVIVAASRLLFRLLMAKSPAKYVVVKNGKDLLFQRKVPKQIVDKLSLKSGTVYQRALGLTLGCSDTELNEALAQSHTLFKIHCRQLDNSSPDALSDSELDMQLTELLRKFNLRAGEFVGVGEKGTKVNNALFGFDDGQIEDLLEWSRIANDPDAPEEVQAQAQALLEGDKKSQLYMRLAEKLTEAEQHQPKTLKTLMVEYFYSRGFEDKQQIAKDPGPTKQRVRRNNQKAIQRIKTLLSIVGEQHANDALGAKLQVGIKNYCHERLKGNTVTTATVKRELADIKSFLNYCIEEYSFNWVVKVPDMKRIAGEGAKLSRKKIPLSIEHQEKFLNYVLNTDHGDHIAGVMCLLYLQGGVMPSEVMHMTLDNGNLTDLRRVPYLNANFAKTKTEARKRIVPIVIGAKYIREHLQETTEWLKRVSDSTSSARNVRFLKKATGADKYTGHCLRHTFKLNFFTNGADTLHACLIAGWEGDKYGHSRAMMNYAMEGIELPDTLKKIYESNQQIHRHLEQFFN